MFQNYSTTKTNNSTRYTIYSIITANIIEILLTKAIIKLFPSGIVFSASIRKKNNCKIVLLSQLTIMALFVLINDMIAVSKNILNSLLVFQLFIK